MDQRPGTHTERAEPSPRTDAQARQSSRGWRDWSPRSLIDLVDRRMAVRGGANPDERLRSPDDEALPV